MQIRPASQVDLGNHSGWRYLLFGIGLVFRLGKAVDPTKRSGKWAFPLTNFN
jgi:hypothetical protein